MFEFSTTSIIIIVVCAVAIILLLFLYIYIARKEKLEKQRAAGVKETAKEKPAAAEKDVLAAEESEKRPLPAEEDIVSAAELAAEVALFAEAAAEPEIILQPEIIPQTVQEPETEAAAGPEQVAEPQHVQEFAAEPETVPVQEPEPAPEPQPAAKPESEPKPAKKSEPDLSTLYQEVDEEDYEQVGTDVADAIAQAFEQVIGPEQAAGEIPQQAASAGAALRQVPAEGAVTQPELLQEAEKAAGTHIRGKITAEKTEEKISDIAVGTAKTAAPGSVRRRRNTGE